MYPTRARYEGEARGRGRGTRAGYEGEVRSLEMAEKSGTHDHFFHTVPSQRRERGTGEMSLCASLNSMAPRMGIDRAPGFRPQKDPGTRINTI